MKRLYYRALEMEKTKAMKLTKDNIEKLVSTNDHGQEDIFYRREHMLHTFSSIIEIIPAENIY